MPVDLGMHWACLTINYVILEGAVTITTTTNRACHLFIYWCPVSPYKTRAGKKRRGLAICYMIEYAMRWRTIVEQTVAGDTLTHTFNMTGWPVCQTRWFFMIGTIGPLTSVSNSPIFHLHKTPLPVTAYFYPDKHPEVTTVDGVVARGKTDETWGNIHNGPGTEAYPSSTSAKIGFWSWTGPGEWWYIRRAVFLFDTSIIPATAEILSAELRLWIGVKENSGFANTKWGVVETTPILNTNLVASDYNKVLHEPLSDNKPYADIDDANFNTWFINDLGLQKVIKGGITKLGLREYTYDCLDVAPLWRAGSADIAVYFSDYSTGLRPRLKVIYQA